MKIEGHLNIIEQEVKSLRVRLKDMVEVVRCKDCKYHEQEEPGMVYCPATVGGWVENDWFCKGGERREDE